MMNSPDFTKFRWRVDMSVAAFTPVVDSSSMPMDPLAHPLDPLSAEEIHSACALLKTTKQLGAECRFAMVHLHEPRKAEVFAFQPGQAMERAAFLMVFNSVTGETYEAVVNFSRDTVVSWVQHHTETAPYGQPPVLVEDFFNCDQIVKADEGWRNAVKRRGLTDEDIKLVQVDPFSAGNFGFPLEAGKRVVRAVSYYRESLKDNAYSHPIEGVVAVVDLIGKQVLQLVDDEVVIPVPKKKHNYDPESLGKPRGDLKPLHISQPEGPSFSVDGWQVKWQKWSFRVGFTSREGLVLHQLGFDDGTGVRPVVYRASVTEMVVPYGDPNSSHFWKNAFDCGEYGLGKLANSLELGCDCLGLIHYFDIPMVEDQGAVAVMKNAVCMHEEDYGILWKHFDFRTGLHQVRRSRRLVISFISTVGNYDYGFYWYLYQDGAIEAEVKATGIMSTAAVPAGEAPRHGTLVETGLNAMIHQHFFSARLDLDVDGPMNSVFEVETVATPPERNPYGNAFETVRTPVRRESEGARDVNPLQSRTWYVVNENRRNAWGQPTAYRLIPGEVVQSFALPGSPLAKRAALTQHQVWFTAYHPRERFAAGDYPNQHAGGAGLPEYQAQDRSLENTDVVVWVTLGHHHVPRPEDWPIMPVARLGFALKPHGFFDRNPSLDVAAPHGAHCANSPG